MRALSVSRGPHWHRLPPKAPAIPGFRKPTTCLSGRKSSALLRAAGCASLQGSLASGRMHQTLPSRLPTPLESVPAPPALESQPPAIPPPATNPAPFRSAFVRWQAAAVASRGVPAANCTERLWSGPAIAGSTRAQPHTVRALAHTLPLLPAPAPGTDRSAPAIAHFARAQTACERFGTPARQAERYVAGWQRSPET